MNQCEQCGQPNADGSQFCRFCGTRMSSPRSSRNDYGYQAPKPYAWKTDEYQTLSEPRPPRVNRVEPLNQPMSMGTSAPVGYHQMVQYPQNQFGPGYRCPYCGTPNLPVVERRISTAGWVVFSVLLVFTFVFFWIGLLMKENVSTCPVCRAKFG